MLDLECFTYLNRALESPISPLVILASNRGLTTIRGSGSTPSSTDGLTSAHGIPPDLLARLLIIPTRPYNGPEIATIVRLRAKTESIAITEPALERISGLGVRVSLRYALQLLSPCAVLAKCNGRTDGVVVDDVKEAEELFLDAGRSASAIREAGAVGWIQ